MLHKIEEDNLIISQKYFRNLSILWNIKLENKLNHLLSYLYAEEIEMTFLLILVSKEHFNL